MRMHHFQISVLKIIMYNTILSFLAIDARTHTCEDCYVHTNNTIMYGGGWLHIVRQHGLVKGKGTYLIIHHPCGGREGVKGLKLVQ